MIKILFSLLLTLNILADTITVSVSVDGRGYKAKKKAKVLAKKDAIKKYIKLKNKNISKQNITKLIEEYPQYIVDLTLEDLSRDGGKSHFVYDVEVDAKAINQELLVLGESIQGLDTNFIVVEEPLDLNTIDFFSAEDFVIYYNNLQEDIKDTISKKLNQFGFKTTNQPSTGVIYSHQRKKYVKDKKFYNMIKKKYPDAVFIQYKVEFLTIINSKIKATLSLKLIDNQTGINIPLDNLSYTIPMESFGFNSIKYSFLEAIRNIIALSSDDLNEKLNDLVQLRNNQPTTITVNFTSRRVAYRVKRELKSLDKINNIVVNNTTIKFYLTDADKEEFLYEQLLPIVEDKLNHQVDDKFIFINKHSIKIDLNKKDFDSKNVKVIIL